MRNNKNDKKKKSKLLKKNIKYFKECVDEFIDYLGLHSYQYVIEPQNKSSARASCYYHSLYHHPEESSRIYTICYTTTWLSDPDTTKKDIRASAYHEVMESLFSNLREYSTNTTHIVTEREVDNEVHEIIRLLENKMLPLIKKPSD